MLYEHAPGDGVDWRGRLDAFVAETDRVFDLLDGVMPEIAWLDDSQTLTYPPCQRFDAALYASACPRCRSTSTRCWPTPPWSVALAPMLGDQHLRVVSVRGFRPRPGRARWTTSTAWDLPIA